MGTLWLGGEVGLGLHTLQGLHASARAKVPGVGRRIFFSLPRKEKKILRPLSTLFSEKTLQTLQTLQYPGYHPPSSSRKLHPPLPKKTIPLTGARANPPTLPPLPAAQVVVEGGGVLANGSSQGRRGGGERGKGGGAVSPEPSSPLPASLLSRRPIGGA